MAFTGTIATEADIALMAGENVDATGDTEANKNLLMTQVEGYLSAVVQYDIVTNWASLDAVSKTLFTEYAARYCAMSLIAYNMSGFESRTEAESMINIHVYRMDKIEEQINKGEVLKQIGVV